MTGDIEELKRQIVQKNNILDCKSPNGYCPNEEDLRRAKRELDRLLYEFYKTHKCNLCLYKNKES